MDEPPAVTSSEVPALSPQELLLAGRFAEAASACREILARVPPGDAGVHVLHGNALHGLGDLEGALASYRAALAVDPGSGRAHYNAGVVLQKLDRGGEAIFHYEAAVAAQPGMSQALVNWGNALKDRGELDSAQGLFLRALAIDPDDVHATNNLASIAFERGALDEARSLYARAANAWPDFADPRFNLGLIALREHDFESGWEAHELRFAANDAVVILPSGLPRFEGRELSPVRDLAVRIEQGIGDQILFSTLLPELARIGIRAVVETDPRLLPAYRRSLPQVEFVSPSQARAAFERCECELPLGSLPRYLRKTLGSFAAQPITLLAPDHDRSQAMRETLGPGSRIGISWRSMQNRSGRRHVSNRKSIPIECFAALAGAGVQLLDLQYGDVEDERSAFDARHPGLRTRVSGLDPFNDLDGVLAAIDTCDLVVTSSNVTAHLAGAIGKATWLVYLDANPPFHYWAPGVDGRCLWYPSVEILSDPRWTTWDAAFEGVTRRWQDPARRCQT